MPEATCRSAPYAYGSFHLCLIYIQQRTLKEIYDKTLVFTLKDELTNSALGTGSIPISRFMIGRKVGEFPKLSSDDIDHKSPMNQK
jgi:hypothetical protein